MTSSVNSPSQSTPVAFAASKYNFYFRHYALCGEWLRKHGFHGLQPLPFEFNLQSASLPRPKSKPHFKSNTETINDSKIGNSFINAKKDVAVKQVKNLIQPKTQTIEHRPVIVSTKRIHFNTQEIDEDYLRAVEINRRHVAERDQHKYSNGSHTVQSGKKLWNNQISGISAEAVSGSQVQYVDYCQVESYVTRSVAPTSFQANHPYSNTNNNYQQHHHHHHHHHHGSKTFTPSITSNHHHKQVMTTPHNNANVTTSKKFVKRFQKNHNDRRVTCWQEQLREQERDRWRAEYDGIYGAHNSNGIAAVKAKETDLQIGFDQFCDRNKPKFWPQLPVRIHFNG
ncbi:gem (nuclear organelle) associated protein 8 [Blomia tropicalis]|nr:gem (nuclear organelle) associated protein 8 [Blomia tropicalis]